MSHLQITDFPTSRTELYQQHTADPIQNMLAPYIKVMSLNIHGLPLEVEYISLADAYNLIKRALAPPEPLKETK